MFFQWLSHLSNTQKVGGLKPGGNMVGFWNFTSPYSYLLISTVWRCCTRICPFCKHWLKQRFCPWTSHTILCVCEGTLILFQVYCWWRSVSNFFIQVHSWAAWLSATYTASAVKSEMVACFFPSQLDSVRIHYLSPCADRPDPQPSQHLRNQSKFLSATKHTLGQVSLCPSNNKEFFSQPSDVQRLCLHWAQRSLLMLGLVVWPLQQTADSPPLTGRSWILEGDWHHHPSSTSQHVQHYLLHTPVDSVTRIRSYYMALLF